VSETDHRSRLRDEFGLKSARFFIRKEEAETFFADEAVRDRIVARAEKRRKAHQDRINERRRAEKALARDGADVEALLEALPS
jgi:hypothetical protein